MEVDLVKMAIIINELYQLKQPIVLGIDLFKFKCDPHSGDVQVIPNKEDSITMLLSDNNAGPYKEKIRQAITMAAASQLISSLRELKDPAINNIIQQTASAPQLEAVSVQILLKLTQATQSSLLARSGLFPSPPQSVALQIVRKELSAVDIAKLTYGMVDGVSQKLKEQLSQPLPTPSR